MQELNVDKIRRMNQDWVLIKKKKEFDNPGKIGSLFIPDQSNLHVRESKIGLVLDCGWGKYDEKGKWVENEVQVGTYVYYTRYGKTKFDGVDREEYIICRPEGVLAAVEIVDMKPTKIYPRMDYLLVEEIELESKYEHIVILKPRKIGDEYKPWRVLEVGYGSKKHPVTVSKGNIVWAEETSGVQISWIVGGERKMFRLIKESECVLCDG